MTDDRPAANQTAATSSNPETMEVTLTAVGPDNRGLADPIVHYVAGAGGNVHEIQMYDRDDEKLFAMLMRVEWPHAAEPVATLRERMHKIGEAKGLTIRTWSRDERDASGSKPRLAICCTYRRETPRAVLEGCRTGLIDAEPAILIGNRDACRDLADEYGVRFENVGDDRGQPDNRRLVALLDEADSDYVVLARYMQIIPPRMCWEYAGGRILNLHHGLLPPFPGFRPYHDAHAAHMLTYGATCHFIIPELDEGNQIVNQRAFAVRPGTSLDDIIAQGQADNEPQCLAEGVRRVVDREVELHFHRVVTRKG